MSEKWLPVFSWRGFQAAGLTFGSVTPLELMGVRSEVGAQLRARHVVVQPGLR